jgi:hypothetical protein
MLILLPAIVFVNKRFKKASPEFKNDILKFKGREVVLTKKQFSIAPHLLLDRKNTRKDYINISWDDIDILIAI